MLRARATRSRHATSPTWIRRTVAALVIVFGCSQAARGDQLAGKWVNHHLVAKKPAVVSLEFLPKDTITITVIDALVNWHPQHPETTSTGQYEVLSPNELKITEGLGSVVVDYRIAGTKLVLSGDGVAQLIGIRTNQPPQTLDKVGP
jgi:hypothetical protein